MPVAAAEVISHSKWDWFRQPRPLSHLNDTESASRSVASSFELLFNAPRASLGIVAALVTTSLAIGCKCLHSIRAFHAWKTKYFLITAGQWDIDADVKGAMIQAMTNSSAFPSSVDDITLSSVAMCQQLGRTGLSAPRQSEYQGQYPGYGLHSNNLRLLSVYEELSQRQAAHAEELPVPATVPQPPRQQASSHDVGPKVGHEPRGDARRGIGQTGQVQERS
ncbi:hypothetical protein PG994_013529 [Apiospora phragmitis]|uniref:Uncharacterized protein n=1 Tax=Apiospora phragmitis TaxID=2905665 RepID=A0ABR1T8W8_9PEZI